jgi:hypothetical protein
MIIRDFTLLGWTAPHPTKRNGDCICAAGYSKEMNQFLRVYPLPFPFRTDIHRWDEIEVPLARNTMDSRHESWKVDYRDRNRDELIALIKRTGKVTKDAEKGWLFKHLSASINQLNSEQRSLGLLKPASVKLAFEQRVIKMAMVTDTLFEVNSELKQNPLIPRIEIVNTDGSTNDLQLLEWGCSEFLRKNPFNYGDLGKALLLNREDYEHLLFVGNNNMHRTTWLAIAMLSYKREYEPQLTLL